MSVLQTKREVATVRLHLYNAIHIIYIDDQCVFLLENECHLPMGED